MWHECLAGDDNIGNSTAVQKLSSSSRGAVDTQPTLTVHKAILRSENGLFTAGNCLGMTVCLDAVRVFEARHSDFSAANTQPK